MGDYFKTPWESILQTCNGPCGWLLDTWFLWLYKQRHFHMWKFFYFYLLNQRKRNVFLEDFVVDFHTFSLLWHIRVILLKYLDTHTHTRREMTSSSVTPLTLVSRGSSPLCSRRFLEPAELLRKRTLMWFSQKREKRMSGRPRRISVLPQNKIKTNRRVFTSKIPNILSRWQDFGLDGLCLCGCAATLSSSTAPRDEAALTWP